MASTPTQTAEATLREQLDPVLEDPVEDLDPDENLIEAGLDSITLMRLTSRLRARGFGVEFADLAAAPTLGAWRALLADARGGVPEAPAAPAPRVDPASPFELAPMQHAYWVGRQDGQRYGGVGSHFYHEFDGPAVDPERLERAVFALMERHPMLRVRVDEDGMQRIAGEPTWPGLTVHELSGAAPEEAERRLDGLRAELSHRWLDAAAGEVFDVRLSLLPGGSCRTHVNLDMLVADAMSFRVLLEDLGLLYTDPDEDLPPVDFDFPSYLAAKRSTRAQAHARDRAWWAERLPELPGAPALPLLPDADALPDPRSARRHFWLDPGQRARFTAAARARGVTPAMAAAAVFAEVMGAWSASPRFLLNLPLFEREDVHPHVERVVGDFTNSVLIAVDLTERATFTERARALQERFHADADHAAYSGVEVLRDLARFHGGSQVLAPVVYTSALNVGELFSPNFQRHFGQPEWIISQVPQVWLDAQLSEVSDGLLVNWDTRESAFPDGVADAMFQAYRDLFTSLVEDKGSGSAWDAPAAPAVPDWALPLIADSPGAAERPRTGTASREEGDAAPHEGAESVVADVWEGVLGGGVRPRRDDDFFVLGGDSLLATRAVTRLRARGVTGARIPLLFENPVLRDFAAHLSLGAGHAPGPVLAHDPALRFEPFPPTEVQRAYWLGRDDAFTLGGVGCHFYREFDTEDLDPVRLERALDTLVERHDALRLVFDDRGDQRVLDSVPRLEVPVSDAADDEEWDRARDRLREEMAHRVFDPSRWPLFDVRVVRHGARARIGVGIDNLALDALSVLTFYDELGRLYADPVSELAPLTLTFRDYVTGVAPDPEALEKARAYWDARLEDLPPAPDLPLRTDPARVEEPRFTRREHRMDTRRWTVLAERARLHGLTPSAVLLAAFSEVLGAWSARPDLTVTVTLFDRQEVHPEVDRIMGDFTSLMLVAYEPGGAHTWLERVRALQDRLSQDLGHREVSAVAVLRDLARLRGEDTAMPVVFTSALGAVTRLAEPAPEPFARHGWGLSQTPQVWLDHQAVEVAGEDGPEVWLNWDAVEDLFEPGVLDAMFDAYLGLLHRLGDDSGERSWSEPVPDLLPPEQRAVRTRVNATQGKQTQELLHTAFFDRARERPDAPAVLHGNDPATGYGALADQALRTAALLRGAGVGSGDLVAVTLPKGPGQVTAVLGVLAAGAAYVPVGADQPPARRSRIHRTAGLRVVLSDLATREAVDWPEDTLVLALEEAAGHAPLPEPAAPDPGGTAYVIFTSGSTGEPKGVDIAHRSAANTVEDVNTRYGVGPKDRVLAVSALDFDLSVYDLFGPLSAGGALVCVDEHERRDALRWAELADQHRVTVWNSVPMLMDMLLVVAEESAGEGLPGPGLLRLALLSGDWVGLDLPGRLAATVPGCSLVVLGGATEASIWSNAFEADDDPPGPGWRSVPYGYPLRNQSFRVVGPDGRDRPEWVPGELWIGGRGVAEGYRGAPELTRERFVVRDGERWYRTGDLGRYRPGAVLEFLGRMDHQVKVRGHRIELGEIEAALESHPAVDRAIALVTGEGSARRLAAGVVAPGGIGAGALRSWAAERLPAHMVPEHTALIDALPLSGNGKVDRARAAALLEDTAPPARTEPPQGATEEALAALWQRVLECGPVGRDTNFFTAGGDSVRAIRFVELARRELRLDVPLRAFFAEPTLRAAAGHAAPPGDVEEGAL